MQILRRATLLSAVVLVATTGCATAQGSPTEVIAQVDGQAPVDRAAVDRWMRIHAGFGSGDGRVPDHPDYRACAQRMRTSLAGLGKTFAQRQALCGEWWREHRDEGLGFLLHVAWARGEAAERGITVSSAEISRRYKELQEQAFPDPADFKQYLRETGFAEADVRLQLELNALERAISDEVTAGLPTATRAQVEAYYRANKARFRLRESRDVRYVQTRTRRGALRARAALRRGRTWKAVVRAYADDPDAGVLRGVERGQTIARFEKAVFAADLRELVGPFKSGKRWYVIRVGRIRPGRQRPLAEVRGNIRELLDSQQRTRAIDTFESHYDAKWKARTRCLAGYVTPDCGAELPPPAPPA